VCLVVRLSRPKFLFYSALLHLSGILLCNLQRKREASAHGRRWGGLQADWAVAALLQLTISLMHLATHFWNEYADFEVDQLNQNAGAWTGGSKVLREGALPRWLAWWLGTLFASGSLLGGAATVERYWFREHGLSLGDFLRRPALIWLHLPTEFVLLGLSVVAVAYAYSCRPLRLCERGVGELCVSYVLTFAAPGVGCLLQGGDLDLLFVCHVLPASIINAARMVVMNIPDRAGDEAGGKRTTVVEMGESRAVLFNNFLYVVAFLYALPQLPLLSLPVRVSHYLLVPMRWYNSVLLNRPRWWEDPRLCDRLPFLESMFVVATVLALNIGLLYDLRLG